MLPLMPIPCAYEVADWPSSDHAFLFASEEDARDHLLVGRTLRSDRGLKTLLEPRVIPHATIPPSSIFAGPRLLANNRRDAALVRAR